MSEHEFAFPADGAVVREVRAKVRESAAKLGADPSVCDNLALVVDELVNNAIEHGADYRKSGHNLVVRMESHGDRLVLEFIDPEMPREQVEDLAAALSETSNGMPSLDSERGRGLFLLSVYLEQLLVEAQPAGGLRLTGNVLCK